MANEIRVWDPLIRVFHWSLVLAFTIAYLSGEEESGLHIYSGYVVMALIIFRLFWGVVGSRYARFSNFVYSPATVISYLKDMFSTSPKRYLGHNPAGGAMILALLFSLVVVTYSGLKVYAIEDGAGPLAKQGSEDTGFVIKTARADNEYDLYDEYGKHGEHEDEEEEEFWEEIHEASANFIVLLVLIHIAGVIVSGRQHNENLVKAMITGNKRAE